VELADNPEKQALGLSWRESMPQDSGMLFIFPTEDHYSIWMRGMSFPLDLIWVSEGKIIVEIRERVSAEPGKLDSDLKIYTPKTKSKYIIEMNAGVVSENGWQVGDHVEF